MEDGEKEEVDSYSDCRSFTEGEEVKDDGEKEEDAVCVCVCGGAITEGEEVKEEK